MEFLPLMLMLVAVAVVAIVVGAIMVINHFEEPLGGRSKKGGIQRFDDYTFGTTSFRDMSTGEIVSRMEWPSIRKAAKIHGVSDRTIRRWRDDKGCNAFAANNRVNLMDLVKWREAN